MARERIMQGTRHGEVQLQATSGRHDGWTDLSAAAEVRQRWRQRIAQWIIDAGRINVKDNFATLNLLSTHCCVF